MATPYRTLDLAVFTGDTWAVRATQAAPPANITRLVLRDYGTRQPFRVKVIPVNGAGVQVVDTTTTLDFRLVKVFVDANGVEKTELLESIVEATGNEQAVGGGFTETDVDARDVVVASFPTITVGTAAALEIYVLRPEEQP